MELENMVRGRVGDLGGGWELDQVNVVDLEKQSAVISVVFLSESRS